MYTKEVLVEILEADWSPCAWDKKMSSYEEIAVWVAGMNNGQPDPLKRTCSAIVSPDGEKYVLVHYANGTLEQVWKVL